MSLTALLLLAAPMMPAAEAQKDVPAALDEAPKADQVVAAAFDPAKKAPAGEPGAANVIPVAAALAVLAGAAILFTRRRKTAVRQVRVIESASLGPKRTVTVVELMGERLALAVTEAGVTVLARVAAPPSPLPAAEPGPRAEAPLPLGEGAWSFAQELESAEDQELRRKLAMGQAGVVP